jgi:cation transport protein ChaC
LILNIRQCYVGRNDNPSFGTLQSLQNLYKARHTYGTTVGSEPLDVLAHRIWRSVGPSGPNKARS